MANTQEILQAVLGMQQNAQARLPVIPNNGNPYGAHNMPENPTAPRPMTPMLPQRPNNNPSWLNASPAMDTIHAILASMGQGTGNTGVVPPPTMQPAVQPVATTGVVMPIAADRQGPRPIRTVLK